LENLLKLQDADKGNTPLRRKIAELQACRRYRTETGGTRSVGRPQASVKADEAARRKYETSIQDFAAKSPIPRPVASR